jgi:hypothetical protein
MIYKWKARLDLPGSTAHLEYAGFTRTLCGVLKSASSVWSDETMLLACRKRCKSCERREKLSKYWLTAVPK